MIIGIKTHFDAAHYLPNYDGECKNLHGHTWHVEVEVQGGMNPKSRMVMDLKELKEITKSIIDEWDHKCLNEIYDGIPTCENIASLLSKFIDQELPAYVKVKRIKIQEGEGGWAIWER